MTTHAERIAAETGLPLSDVLDNAPDEASPACHACNGCTERVGIFRQCIDCGGVHGNQISRAVARQVFGIGQDMISDAHDVTYFDIEVGGRRVHGWYSPSRARVVQYG